MKQTNTLLRKATNNRLTKPETATARLAETVQERQTDNNAKLRFKVPGAGQVQAYHLFGAA